jgi:DNA-binding Lrp family transcriptional regulator
MLDEVDKKILNLLQKNAKLTIKDLAEQLNLTTTPIFERIKRMEREGFISAYVALVNPQKVEKSQVVFCNISIRDYAPQNIQIFEEAVQKMPEVLECYHLAGTVDYQLKILVKDIQEYDLFVREFLKMPMVRVQFSSIVLHPVKYSTAILV